MQTDYITGVLDKNEVIEAYHGIAFQRRLTLHTLYGKRMQLDDQHPIGTALEVGTRYNFVVAVSNVERVRAFTHSNTMSAQFSGTIRELRWKPTPEQYLAFNADYLNQPMSIIGTAYGHVLLSRLLLGGAEVGNAVTWGKDSFELIAVYR